MSDEPTICAKCQWVWKFSKESRPDVWTCGADRDDLTMDFVSGEFEAVLCRTVNRDGKCPYYAPKETP